MYFVGRLGAARVVLLQDGEPTPDGTPVWNLAIQEVRAQDSHETPPPARRAPRQKSLFKAPEPAGRAPDPPSDRVDDLWRGDP